MSPRPRGLAALRALLLAGGLATTVVAPGAVASGAVASGAAPAPTVAVPALRIASLAPSLTELVYAAGAGQRLVATVEFSDYPEAARALPRIGDAFRVDFERLVAAKPDLVLSWASGTPSAVVERVESLGLRHVSITTQRLADVPIALRRIGALTGSVAPAEVAARRFEQRVDELRRRPAPHTARRVFIEIDDQPLYTVNGDHVISEVVELCGGRNVFAELPQLAPAVTLESVLAADPDVILSTDDTVADPLARWSQWPQLRAVRNRAVHSVPSDLVARATPRLLAGIEAVCALL